MKQQKVLLVGKYESLLVARSLLLQQAGYHVQVATDHSQAILGCAEGSFDVAVLCEPIDDADPGRLAHCLELVGPGVHLITLNRRDSIAIGDGGSPELVLALVRCALGQKQPTAEQKRA